MSSRTKVKEPNSAVVMERPKLLGWTEWELSCRRAVVSSQYRGIGGAMLAQSSRGNHEKHCPVTMQNTGNFETVTRLPARGRQQVARFQQQNKRQSTCTV